MARPIVALRIIQSQQIRAKDFRRSQKAKNPPKSDNEDQKPSSNKWTNPQDPVIPSWRHGFFRAIDSFMAAYEMYNCSKAATESDEVASGAIISF